jgi:hypothetical protein
MSFALVEQQDYDIIGRTMKNGDILYTPIQLKEYRKSVDRPSLEDELAKLQKYTDSKDLVVAFWLSGTDSYDFSALRVPPLNIAGLWFFGSISKDQTEWVLIGDMLKELEIKQYKIA